MRGSSDTAGRLRDRLAGDAGFALVEVMVSAVILVIFATATLSIIERSGAAAATDRSRAAATQLAQQDQDAMRLMSIKSLSNYHVVHDPVTVGGLQYTVESQAEWLRDDSTGRVVCDGSTTRVEYAKITSQVTWTNHPIPVTLESYVSPGVKGIALGSLAVKLHNDGSSPTSGITINFQGQAVPTDENGCAIFTALNPGMSNATWSGATSLPNYVDKNGSNAVTKSVNIGAGQNSFVDAMFDRASTIPARFIDDVGNNVVWNTVSAANSGMDAPGIRVFGRTTDTKAGTLQATTLFPFATPYTLYAGSCAGNAPATWDTSGSTSTLGQRIAPAGATAASVDVPLPDVGVQVRQGSGYLSNVPVSFTPSTDANMAGCTDRIAYGAADAPKTSATGDAAVTQLPWGQYVACALVGSVGGTAYYARRTINNTPLTTTGGFPQTHDPITMASPYASKLNKIATGLLNTKVTSTAIATNDGGTTAVTPLRCS